jgi:hypothetical protein
MRCTSFLIPNPAFLIDSIGFSMRRAPETRRLPVDTPLADSRELTADSFAPVIGTLSKPRAYILDNLTT